MTTGGRGIAATRVQFAFGRFPWFAFFFLRPLPLRARFAMGSPPTVGIVTYKVSPARASHKRYAVT